MSTRFYVAGPPSFWQEDTVYGTPECYETFPDARWVGKEIKLQPVICPANPRHRHGKGRQNDLTITLPSPRIGDFHYTVYGEPMITDRVLTLFREAGITGFTTRPVNIRLVGRSRRERASAEMPRLWEFVVTGDGGYAHPDSGIRLLIHCPTCGFTRYSTYRNGIIVDETQWDSSDVFRIREWRSVRLVTDKVKEVIMRHKLTNVVLLPAEALRWPDDIPRPEEFEWE